MRRPLGPGHVLNLVTQTPRLETALAGEAAVVKAKGAGPAAAGADEKGPAAAVGETDVLKADDEYGGVGEGDGSGRIVGADEAGGPQARDADVGEIVDRCPHEREN